MKPVQITSLFLAIALATANVSAIADEQRDTQQSCGEQMQL